LIIIKIKISHFFKTNWQYAHPFYWQQPPSLSLPMSNIKDERCERWWDSWEMGDEMIDGKYSYQPTFHHFSSHIILLLKEHVLSSIHKIRERFWKIIFNLWWMLTNHLNHHLTSNNHQPSTISLVLLFQILSQTPPFSLLDYDNGKLIIKISFSSFSLTENWENLSPSTIISQTSFFLSFIQTWYD